MRKHLGRQAGKTRSGCVLLPAPKKRSTLVELPQFVLSAQIGAVHFVGAFFNELSNGTN